MLNLLNLKTMEEELIKLAQTPPIAWALLMVMVFITAMIVRIQYEKDVAKMEQKRKERKNELR